MRRHLTEFLPTHTVQCEDHTTDWTTITGPHTLSLHEIYVAISEDDPQLRTELESALSSHDLTLTHGEPFVIDWDFVPYGDYFKVCLAVHTHTHTQCCVSHRVTTHRGIDIQSEVQFQSGLSKHEILFVSSQRECVCECVIGAM